MRLIDAERIVYSWIIDKDGEQHDGVTLQSIIDKVPTVDAIPIDWILNHEKMPKSGKGHDAIMDMIESWRERREDAKTD